MVRYFTQVTWERMMNTSLQWNQNEVEPPLFSDLDLVTKIWKTQAEPTTEGFGFK